MPQRPTLETERLILRPFVPDDAKTVQHLAGDRDVAVNLISVPYPYEDGMAEAWIATHQASFDQGRSVAFAIVRKADGLLVGAISLMNVDCENERAEMGYWLGKAYWGIGYATEAGRMVLRYGFDVMKLHKIVALCFTRNRASANVMRKLGMTHEGCLRQHFKKWDVFEDDEVYGILASDYHATKVD